MSNSAAFYLFNHFLFPPFSSTILFSTTCHPFVMIAQQTQQTTDVHWTITLVLVDVMLSLQFATGIELESLRFYNSTTWVLLPEERVLASLHAILCGKAARLLRGRDVFLSVSGQNDSLGKLSIELKMSHITQLLTLLHAQALYSKTNARVEIMFEDVLVTFELSIRTVNAGSFIQRVMSSQRRTVRPLQSTEKPSPLGMIVFFHSFCLLHRDLTRKVVQVSKAYGTCNSKDNVVQTIFKAYFAMTRNAKPSQATAFGNIVTLSPPMSSATRLMRPLPS